MSDAARSLGWTRPGYRQAADPAAPVLLDRLALAQPQHGEGPYSGIRLTDVVGAMSFALDLAEGQPRGHSVRTTMIGMRLAEAMDLPEESRSALFYALLLKDLGASSNAATMSGLYGADDRALKRAHRLIDWTDPFDRVVYDLRYARTGRMFGSLEGLRAGPRIRQGRHDMALLKSERGAEIAGMLALPAATCEAIRSVDEHWNGHGVPSGLRRDAIPLLARIVCLAQTLETFEHAFDVRAAYRVAHRRRGRWFDPELVDCLDAFSDDAAFWGRLQSADALSALSDCEPPSRVVYADELRLDTIAEAFAKVIDAKSPFTLRHSQNVAFLASRTATEMGLPRREVRAIRRAALLHDVGKLGVSSQIIDKPSSLTPAEMAEMRRHTVYTYEILRGVKRFERFAMLAASHHERLDGRGYHQGLVAEELDPPARILAVADVCDALCTDRPYRAGIPVAAAVIELQEMAERGELCPEAVEGLAGWFRGSPGNTDEFTAHGDSTSMVM
jgi:putative nucleotidyltransferase with HDIG domain